MPPAVPTGRAPHGVALGATCRRWPEGEVTRYNVEWSADHSTGWTVDGRGSRRDGDDGVRRPPS